MPYSIPFGRSAAGGNVIVEGYEEFMQSNRRMIETLRPSSGLGEAVRVATLDLEKFAIGVTHVWTGTLRASHRIDFSAHGIDEAEAALHVSDTTRNPVTHELPAIYGEEEELRGGSHAFYGLTFTKRGDYAVERGADAMENFLNNA